MNRRQFLRASTAALALPGVITSGVLMPTTKIIHPGAITNEDIQRAYDALYRNGEGFYHGQIIKGSVIHLETFRFIKSPVLA